MCLEGGVLSALTVQALTVHFTDPAFSPTLRQDPPPAKSLQLAEGLGDG